MKARFSILDVIASVEDIKKSCIGLRAANFYDINKKTYLIKFGSGDKKVTVLIEYGVRIHSTNYTWTKNIFPSSFSMKCRKTIGNRRLTDIKQLGIDRIVDFTFGTDESPFHLIVELYSKGNLLLTDCNYTILSILRQRKIDEEVMLATSQKYIMDTIRQREPIISLIDFEKLISSSEAKGSIRKFMASTFQLYGSQLIDHCLLEYEFLKDASLTPNFIDSENMTKLYQVVILAEKILNDFVNGINYGGYIILKTLNEDNDPTDSKKFNFEFHPYLFNQYKSEDHKKFDTFCEAVDEFFSQIEEQKTETQLISKEKAGAQKIQNVIKDHEIRIKSLTQEKDTTFQYASLIEVNKQLVDDVIILLNSALSKRIPWASIETFIKDAKEDEDPLALTIDYVKFETNQVAVWLKDNSSEKQLVEKPVSILVDLSLTAYANSQKYFDIRRTAIEKHERTTAAQNKALKSAKQKMNAVLKETKVQIRVKKNRKQNWFERYRWFISSDNYLVLAGKEAQENEFLVKRHGGKNDIFVHADLHGSATVIIKVQKDQIRENSELPVPIRTINEAATFAVCFSSGWDNRVTVPAYWVYMSQVSKTPETGEYLKIGGFVIRGKKNYIPPPNLILGLGMLFKLDPESTEKHLNDRVSKFNLDDTSSVNEKLVIEESSAEVSVDHSLSSESDHSSIQHKEQLDQVDSEAEAQFPDNTKYIDHLKKNTFDSTLSNVNDMADTVEEKPHIENGSPLTELSAKIVEVNHSVEGTKIETEKNISIKSKDKLSKPPLSTVAFTQSETEKHLKLIPENNKSLPIKSTICKRGQKSKKKLINTKYKDQDEDERELAMNLLHVSLKPHTSKTAQRKDKQKYDKQKLLKFIEDSNCQKNQNTLKQKQINPKEKATVASMLDENLDNSDKEDNVDEANLLSSFTGKPFEDDQLLYPLFVCAPYSAIVDYKFKIKLTPGNTKRGRAVKTALTMFSAAKDACIAESELINSLKELDNTRNLPPSVKVSAPHMTMKKNKQPNK